MSTERNRILFITTCILTGLCIGLFIFLHMPEQQYRQKLTIGLRFLNAGNYDRAEASFLDAIEIDPKKTEAYQGMVSTYMIQADEVSGEDPEQAERYYDMALSYVEKARKAGVGMIDVSDYGKYQPDTEENINHTEEKSAKTEKSGNTLSESTASSISSEPDYSGTLDAQVQLLYNNMDQMCSDETFQNMPARPFCWVSDYDHDGLLEFNVAVTMGTGIFTTSRMYEVNDTLDGVNQITWDNDEYAPDYFTDFDGNNYSADQGSGDVARTGYYDPKTGQYYYIVYDTVRGGIAQTVTAYYAFSLDENTLNWEILGSEDLRRDNSGTETTTYTLQDGTVCDSEEALFSTMRAKFSDMREFQYYISTFSMSSENRYDDLMASARAAIGD